MGIRYVAYMYNSMQSPLSRGSREARGNLIIYGTQASIVFWCVGVRAHVAEHSESCLVTHNACDRSRHI